MINRFIKILLCFLLIIIQISTYANISVSDGSAFVTKSEMSYQLNNLSNRMTQLENSLDSKIDTLVSSYLTRNGVWNGVKQTLNKTQIVDIWNNISAITFSCDYKSQLVTSSLTPGTEYKLRSGSWDLIKKCTKSGMLVGKWTVMNGYDYTSSTFCQTAQLARSRKSFLGVLALARCSAHILSMKLQNSSKE